VTDRRLLYLIGQFPAINHKYLLAEVRHLLSLGFEVPIASVSSPDRLPEKLSPDERDEAARTYYLKAAPPMQVLALNISEFLRQPLQYLQGLFFALRLAGASPSRVAYHLAYFVEAILVGRRMRELRISHVHAHFSATVALIVTRAFPVTMSFTVHGFGELYDPAGTHLPERIKDALFVRSISQYGRSQLMLACDRSAWPKLTYVPLGIDAAEFPPLRERSAFSPPRVVCVGRLSPEKGQSLLLEAAALLWRQNCPMHLKFVGDGPERPLLERLAVDLGIERNVEFAGWVSPVEMKKVYAEADICVLPSLAEGIPIVLMEAMAMQIPCVAPCITGIPELIEQGIEGLLFTVSDVEDLAAKMRELLQSADLRVMIGKNGRSRVLRDYDLARNTARFAKVLEEQLKDELGEKVAGQDNKSSAL
jgi:colanic acid/amylovoran biosynthesis glycosyltransferase